jgi:hypothetical protein
MWLGGYSWSEQDTNATLNVAVGKGTTRFTLLSINDLRKDLIEFGEII